MKIYSSKFLQNIGVYTVSNIINASIPFLLLPVLTRYLSTEDYGVTATFQVLIGFFIPFIGLNTQGAITRKYFHTDKSNFGSYVSTCLVILLLSTVAISIIIAPLAPLLSDFTKFPAGWMWSVFVVAFFQYICSVVLGILQVEGKVFKYSLFQNAQTALNIISSLIFIILLKMNWQGRLTGQLLATAVFGIFGIIVLFNMRLLKKNITKNNVYEALRFGIPLIPYSFTGWILLSMDRIFINKMVNLEQTGLYATAFQICMIITLVQTSFNNAWVPWIFGKLSLNDSSSYRRIVKFSYLFVAANFLLAIFITVAGPFFIEIFLGKDFYAASVFLLWLSLAQAANSIHVIAVSYIFFHNKNIYLTYSALLTTLIHVPITYFLVKENGAIGAAQSLFISNAFASVCTFIFAVKFQKMPWLL